MNKECYLVLTEKNYNAGEIRKATIIEETKGTYKIQDDYFVRTVKKSKLVFNDFNPTQFCLTIGEAKEVSKSYIIKAIENNKMRRKNLLEQEKYGKRKECKKR